MADMTTTNYSLPKPAAGKTPWYQDYYDALDKIDAVLAMAASQGFGSSRPTYIKQGGIWTKNTVTPWEIYRYDGTDDILVGTLNAATNSYIPYMAGQPIPNPPAIPVKLVVKNSLSTPNTSIDIAAESVVVSDGTTKATLENVNVTVDCSLNGQANRLDAGSLANGTWYYFWVIYNPTSKTVAGLASTSATAPTLPTGYTHKRLVSQFITDGSAHLTKARQVGNRVDLAAHVVVVNQGASVSFAPISLASCVPPNAVRAFGAAFAVGGNYYIGPDGLESYCWGAGTNPGGEWTCPLPTPQTAYYYVNAGYMTMHLLGYEVSL